MKTLHEFLKQFYRKPIPLMVRTPALIELFDELKKGVKFSPVLAIFYPDKPTFLKTDLSAEGMGWIIMQPADDE